MAREFDDASSQYLQVSFSASEPFAAACHGWLDDSNSHVLMSVGQSGGTRYHALMYFSSACQAYSLGTEGGGGASAGAQATGQWFFACGIWVAANDRRCWRDSNKGTDTSTQTVASPDRVCIGVTADNTPFGYHDGKVAVAAIWNLSVWPGATASDKADEFERVAIPSLGAGESPLRFGLGLEAYWPLIRDEDQDRVGGHHLTAYNSPTVADHPPKIKPYWFMPWTLKAPVAAGPEEVSLTLAMVQQIAEQAEAQAAAAATLNAIQTTSQIAEAQATAAATLDAVQTNSQIAEAQAVAEQSLELFAATAFAANVQALADMALDNNLAIALDAGQFVSAAIGLDTTLSVNTGAQATGRPVLTLTISKGIAPEATGQTDATLTLTIHEALTAVASAAAAAGVAVDIIAAIQISGTEVAVAVAPEQIEFTLYIEQSRALTQYIEQQISLTRYIDRQRSWEKEL